MEPAVHIGTSAARRLAELGIPQKALRRAIQGGDAEARSWTEAAPRNMPGMARWGRTNEMLRTGLGREGFTYENPGGLPVTISPDSSFKIVATTGDEYTGQDGKHQPTTRYAKGTAMAKAVEHNGQLALDIGLVDAEIGPTIAEAASSETISTWVLLYHVAPKGIYAELSLPASISPVGFIDRWRERIILPMYELGPEPEEQVVPDEDDGGFDVAVEPR